ncbi:MAG TPA: hypothetical protein VEC01_02610, partial [Noviherbaspirillum sp.]|uniref:hypothetical protein n=1 Tax=Noviherbaspirillum sp. TaxID=1926288 RepID=UPI002D5E0057
HQAPTLIGCYLLKNLSAKHSFERFAANRFVRQQQRNEIMKHLSVCVKRISHQLVRLTASFCSAFQLCKAAVESFCSSAAKRWDYGALSRYRQPLRLKNLKSFLPQNHITTSPARHVLQSGNRFFLHRFATGGELYQRFRKLGKRFSKKAFMPSF